MTPTPPAQHQFAQGASAQGHHAAREANQQRGTLLALLHTGKIDLPSAIRIAAQTPRLRKIRLDHLLQATGTTPSQAARIINHTIRDTNSRIKPNKATIGWLTDPRTKGTRILALAARLQPPTDTPWPGYPLQGPPQ